MPSQVIQRQTTDSEQASLAEMLSGAPTTGRRWKDALENTLVMWAVSLLGIVAIWLAFAWVGRKFFGAEFGLQSSAAIWILGISTPLCAIYAAVSTALWIKGLTDYRPLLRADIQLGQVSEEHYVFTQALRFQEPEHGWLIYFLRTVEDKVLVLDDRESRDLWVQEREPAMSSFRPQEKLVLIRAPRTGSVISRTFSGKALEVGDPIELACPPEEWPQSESYCNIPWDELKARLGPHKTGKAT